MNFAYGENKCVSCHQDTHTEKYSNCTLCHRGNKTTSRKDIAHYKLITGQYAEFNNVESKITKKGIEIINNAQCTRCHLTGYKGTFLATNLNSTVKRLSSNEIIKAIKEPAINMPKFNFSDNDYRYILTGLYYYTINTEEISITQIVRLSNNHTSSIIFNNKCGGCHKAITNIGALGFSNSAPNLSSLKNSTIEYLNGKYWNKENLKQWIDNPRSIKYNATMPKIQLNKEESENIIHLLLD